VVWAWAWAAALAAAAAGVLMVVMTKPAAIPAPDLPRLAVAAPPVEVTAHPWRGSNRSLTVAAPRRVVMPRAGVAAIKEQTPTLGEIATPATPTTPAPPAVDDSPVHMVQLATDDPNVVIYWQLEGTGE
jgi:hypothetical protein